MDFYRGRVLRIDLSAGTSLVEPLNMEWAERYIGGKGLLLRYLWDEVPPQMDPWAPESPTILMTGPFAGTGVSTASRLVVGCKSPTTGIYTDSYVGGSMAPEIKFAGYDAIIVSGESPEPVVIMIRNDAVSFVPARPRYWGLTTSEIEEAMRTDFDPAARTISIGPAGENEIPWACLSTDQSHKAGRGGIGALWGRKNLKAITVRGTGAVNVGDARDFLNDMYRVQMESVLNVDNLWTTEEGTALNAQFVNAAGLMPTRNWSAGTFDGIDKINSDAMQKIKTRNRACYQCALGCRQWHEAGGIAGEGPEYETIALCGSNCGVSDIQALMKFNMECDELGIDTIATGSVTALAMDLSEQGAAEFGLRFGQTQAYLEVPGLVARREGIGAELALGTRALAAKHGRPELASEVKNLDLPGYDPRGAFGMSLAYATSDRGGCHMRAWSVGDEIMTGTLRPDDLEGKAQFVIDGQNSSSIRFSAILCDFWGLDSEVLSQLMNYVLGHGMTASELAAQGERIWNLGRLFNLREGVEPDTIPERLYEERFALRDGPAAGKAIGAHALAAALLEYYALRGWDDHGVPSEAKLAELGVDVRL